MELKEELTIVTKILYKDLETLDHLKSLRVNDMPDKYRIKLEERIASLEDRIKLRQGIRETLIKELNNEN